MMIHRPYSVRHVTSRKRGNALNVLIYQKNCIGDYRQTWVALVLLWLRRIGFRTGNTNQRYDVSI